MIQGEYEVPDDLNLMSQTDEHAVLVDMYLRLTGLRCGACRLELIGSDEVRAAKMPERIEYTANARNFLGRLERDRA